MLPPPKPLTIPDLKPFESLSEKYALSDVDYTTFSLLYPRLPPSNFASKHTTSSLDNLLDTSSESTIRRLPRHRHNLRYNGNPTPLFIVLTPLY